MMAIRASLAGPARIARKKTRGFWARSHPAASGESTQVGSGRALNPNAGPVAALAYLAVCSRRRRRTLSPESTNWNGFAIAAPAPSLPAPRAAVMSRTGAASSPLHLEHRDAIPARTGDAARIDVEGRDEAFLAAGASREMLRGSEVHAAPPACGDVAAQRIGIECNAARDPVEVRGDVEREGIPAAVGDRPTGQIH